MALITSIKCDMASYSERTIATLAPILEARFTRQVLCVELVKRGVPSALVYSPKQQNKLSIAMSALGHLLQNNMVEDLSDLIDTIAADERISNDARLQLARALMADGFALEDGHLVSPDPDEEDIRDVLVAVIERHPEFSREALLHHIEECEKLYAGESWGASIGQARNVCELLLNDIARSLAARHGDSPDLSRPVRVRDYLEKVGFLDATERKKLIDGAYSYLSEEGAHPGISDQSSARVSRIIARAIAFYLVEKYEGQPSE